MRKRKPDALPITAECITDGVASTIDPPEWCYRCGAQTNELYNVQGTSQPMPLCEACAENGRRQLELGE